MAGFAACQNAATFRNTNWSGKDCDILSPEELAQNRTRFFCPGHEISWTWFAFARACSITIRRQTHFVTGTSIGEENSLKVCYCHRVALKSRISGYLRWKDLKKLAFCLSCRGTENSTRRDLACLHYCTGPSCMICLWRQPGLSTQTQVSSAAYTASQLLVVSAEGS